MKTKILFFSLCIITFLVLLAGGCSSSKENGQVESSNSTVQTTPPREENNTRVEKKYMPDPRIVIGYRRTGLYSEEYTQYEVTGNSVEMGGPIEYIDIIFEKSVEGNNIKKLITMNGCGITNFEDRGPQIIRIGIGNIRGVKGTLAISKDIVDASGRYLKDDIKVDINILAEGARADYKIEGIEGIYDRNKYYEGFLVLTTQDKNFIINFTKAVDRKSVEASIGKVLSQRGVTYTFQWLDDMNLRLCIHGLKSSKGESGTSIQYTINVEDAVDCDGDQICYNLNFYANDPNSFGYIDVGTKKITTINTFNDLSYMVYTNYYMDKYAVIHNPYYMRSLFDFNENRVVNGTKDDHYWYDKWNMDWIDGNTLLTYDREKHKIYKYTVDKGLREEIPLPFIGSNKSFLVMRVSPDLQKIALFYNGWEPSDLYILSMDGRLLYKYDDIVNFKVWKAYNSEQDIAWLDNENIVVDDGGPDKPGYDIVKINIENGEKKTLIKGAITPAALPGKDMVVANRYNNNNYGLSEYVIISGGKEVGTIKWKPYSTDQAVLCSNIQFTDDDHLVFNRNDDLVLYTISQNKEETICKGAIVGLSQDRSRVYFMTNYVWLYSSD